MNFENVFETFLRLLSPFMPFISEELWQRLPNNHDMAKSVMVADYPTSELVSCCFITSCVSKEFSDLQFQWLIMCVHNRIRKTVSMSRDETFLCDGNLWGSDHHWIQNSLAVLISRLRFCFYSNAPWYRGFSDLLTSLHAWRPRLKLCHSLNCKFY